METKSEISQNQQDLLDACQKDQFDTVLTLLREGVNPQFTFDDYPQSSDDEQSYLTPIGEILKGKHYTVERLNVLLAILDAGVDVNSATDHSTDRIFDTPLGILLDRIKIYKKNSELYQEALDLLLSRGADIGLVNPIRIHNFVTSAISSKDLLAGLINSGLDVEMNFRGMSLVEHLIFNSSAFMPAANQYAKLTLLIESGAVVPQRIPTDCRNIDPQMFIFLVEKSPEIIGEVSLHDLFVLSSPEILKFLINRGFDLNVLDLNGHTPLMKCCVLGYDQAAVILMEAGANLDIADAWDKTALHHAFSNVLTGDDRRNYYRANSRLFIALELYIRGASPTMDKSGKTPIMSLANSDPKLVKFCVGEFTQFEAAYMEVDVYTLAVGHWLYHVPNTKSLVKSSLNEDKRFSAALQSGNVIYLINDVVIKEDTGVNFPNSRLMAALENNNLIVAKKVIESTPELDLATIRNVDGFYALEMLIYNATAEKDIDCLPLIKYLADKISRTEYNGPLIFALDALGNYTGECKDNYHLQIIEQLLLIGFNLDSLTNIVKDRARYIGFKKLLSSELYQRYQMQPGNLVDSILFIICSRDNFKKFLQAVKSNFLIHMGAEDNDKIYLLDVLAILLKKDSLTFYARNRIKHLMLKDECSFDVALTNKDVDDIQSLTRALYSASIGIEVRLAPEFAAKLEMSGDKRCRVDGFEYDAVTPFWKRGTGSGVESETTLVDDKNYSSEDVSSSNTPKYPNMSK